MTRRRTHSTLTAMLAFLAVMLATELACAPAAPAGQGGALANSIETKAAPTPTLMAAPTHEGWDGLGMLPPTPTLTQMERQYPNLDSNLFPAIVKYEADLAALEILQASGNSGQPALTPVLVGLSIYTDTAERVDELQRFLETHGAINVTCDKGSSEDVIKGGCGADVPVSLLRLLAEQVGVLKIETERTRIPTSELRSPVSQQALTDAHGVTAWRLAVA